MSNVSSTTYRILLAEDDELDRELIQSELAKLGLPFELVTVTSSEAYATTLSRKDLQGFDLIIADRDFPRVGNLNTLEAANSNSPKTPFILVYTGQNETVAANKSEGVPASRVHHLSMLAAVVRGIFAGPTKQPSTKARATSGSIHREERFTKVVEQIRDYVIMTLDPNGLITSWNLGGERILGYSAAEILGKHFSIFFTPEDQANGVVQHELEEARRTGAAEDERWHLRKDGIRFWASGLTTTILEENDEEDIQIVGFAKIMRDQTDRQLQLEERDRLSKEVLHERERLASLISSIPGIVWESSIAPGLDPALATVADLKINFVSPYITKMLGYAVEDFVIKPFSALDRVSGEKNVENTERKDFEGHLFPLDREQMLEHVTDLFGHSTEGRNQYRLVAKDGRVLWVEAFTAAVKDAQGRPVGLRGVVLDITDRKQAELENAEAAQAVEVARSAAEASELRYRYLAEAMPQIVYVTNADGAIEYYNRKWHEFTGQLTGQENWAGAIHPDDREQVRTKWEGSIRTGIPFEAQIRILSKDGTYHWFLSRSIPLRNPAGEITQWIGTSTDIEAQKHSEESLQFLAQASEILAGSLNYEETLKRVAQLAVPHIADWCSVEIVNEKGTTDQLAVAHVDPDKVKWALEINKKYPPDPNASTGVPQVIRTGRSEFYPELSEELLRTAAVDDEHWHIIQEIGFTSIIIVPLKAREIVFGAITLVTAEAKRIYTESDLKLAEDLGRRAAIAVDNAWLYKKAQEEIAEREQTETALRESEQRYRIVAETATDAIITIDESSRILFVNPATTKIFGYTVAEMMGHDVVMLMPDLYRAVHKKAIDRYVETKKKHIDWEGVELPGLHKNGQEIPLEISFGEFIRDGHHIFTGIVRDISERKRVEHELRTSETRFRTMIEQSPLGIQLFDLTGNCIQANRAWEELWGASREALVGYNILKDPQLSERGMKQYVERAYDGEAVVMPPFLYDPKESGNVGRERWVRIFVYPVKNEEQGLQEVAIILEDITERRLAEIELRRAKELAEGNEKKLVAANAAKDQFLAILSHELRTPLTPVMATVQALQSDNTDEALKPWLEIIQRNVELEARLIDDLLDLTRITKGKLQLNLEPVDAHALLHNVIDIYRSEIQSKRLELMIELTATAHHVIADPARLQQVFWNLVKNSVKFTPEGGKILINSSNIVEENSQTPILRIEFTDTGIGIEPELLPRIFDAFEQGEKTITRNFGGLGLGLAISKNLVDMHGGELTAISSGKDMGATFMVDLTTTLEKGQSANVNVIGEKAEHATTPVILLIDDHIDTSTAIRMLLERQGYEVKVANSAAEAIKTATGLAFDLVISDIGLPDENGLVLLPKLREIRKTPAIALSGFGTEEDVARSQLAGFQEHLTKPFNLQKLRDTITKLLNR